MALTLYIDTYVDETVAMNYVQARYPRIPSIMTLATTTASPPATEEVPTACVDPYWEAALRRACDNIEELDPAMWQGWKTNIMSPLQWCRVAVVDRRINAWGYSPVYGFGFFFDMNSIPNILQNAQCEEALILYLLDNDPGYIPALLDEQKGIVSRSVHRSSMTYQPKSLYGGSIHSHRCWKLLSYLRRDRPARIVMC